MQRRSITIRGTVQGVGFRPFVFTLATSLHLTGHVQNRSGLVQIEAEGDPAILDVFLSQLTALAPPLSHIDELSWTQIPLQHGLGFLIKPSENNDPSAPIIIAPDTATCDDCLAELFNPRDRRYRYPFNNCTNCGPRLSIVTGSPYDRSQTTMASFPLCPACAAEYHDPANRRFHAQPIACPTCGPHLQALNPAGDPVPHPDPLAYFVSALIAGQIGAMKGLGGYHLICDAANPAAVAELRRRKHREEKPFALMVPDLSSAASLCEINSAEQTLLLSPRRPIVLLRKRPDHSLPDSLAPDSSRLGIMLPYTPLHHLLLHDIARPLVMTSGNRSDEPIAYQDSDAVQRLTGIADLFLIHNRPIHIRCDDSVTRTIASTESPIRRSRGYAPQPIPLPFTCPSAILAVGAQMKSTFAIGRDRQAILSQHMGDLDHFEASQAFERDIALYEKLFSATPACIAHDLHPDYASTRYAQKRAAAGIPLIPTQHHHAHLASCMAEHSLASPVLGIIWDGTGLGTDNTIWGGEFLLGDYKSFRRAAHLRYIPLPGGEKAVREPWRMALSYLHDARLSCPSFESRLPPASIKTLRQMIDRHFNAPLTSSAGRLFDAVASLIGLRDHVSYEGQAAILLEQLATPVLPDYSYPFTLIEPDSPESPCQIDLRPMIASIVKDLLNIEKTECIARRFQTTLVDIISAVCTHIRTRYGVISVALSGGVFMNALLTHEVTERLQQENFLLYRHRIVPPNDGGISLGQLAIAASQLTPA